MHSEVRMILSDIRASRRQVFAELEGLPEERLTAPALWGGREFDARFVLLRYADHEEEHALQVRKTLDGFGWRQSEAQQILGAACMTRGDLYGALLGLGVRELDVRFDDDPHPTGPAFYYARVFQTDGEMAWSSPIWVTPA